MRISSLTTIAAALAAGLLATGCGKDKDYDFSWLEEVGIECPDGVKDFNEKYVLLLTNVVSAQTYSFDGSYTVPTSYTPASDEQTVAVADYLDKEVFALFPEGFIAANMPGTIYVADSVGFSWTYEFKDYDAVRKKDISRTVENTRNVCGEVGGKQITFSAKALETRDRDSLRFEWTSLVIERMMSNTNRWPEPTEFMKLAQDRIYNYFEMSYFKYYQDTYGKKSTTFGEPLTPYTDRFNLYYYCGSFRPCRYSYLLHYYYSEEYAKASKYGDSAIEGFVYYIMTYRQDFADMVAFLLCFDKDEREAMIRNAAVQKTVKEYSTYDSSGNKTVREEELSVGREIFDERIALVKSYLKENLDWTIE